MSTEQDRIGYQAWKKQMGLLFGSEMFDLLKAENYITLRTVDNAYDYQVRFEVSGNKLSISELDALRRMFPNAKDIDIWSGYDGQLTFSVVVYEREAKKGDEAES